MTRDDLKQRYVATCAELGDLTLQRERLDARIAVVKAAAEALQTLASTVEDGPVPE